MKQVILGTAGHIDHGKTSLIKALTGIDADRLKEEKERGITIELGFAHMELPGGQLLGIVDVPGHEKFIKNMVAGATGIDLVALVIAADEGVMPQTREHLDICQLLGIRHGIVVLTKKDMVEQEWLELVREDVANYLAGSFLEDAPLVEVSSTKGQGLDELVKVIDEMVREIPEREPGNFFRLPVDRVFTMKGFGTVVTGTTISGEISIGDDVTVYPQGLSSKIRGIQAHNHEADRVRAGLRTAINLQGAEKAQIQRGNVLAAKDSLRSTYMVDVLLELIQAAPRKLKNRAKARFHSGTAEIISTVVLLDRDELKPGDTCPAQIRLDEPTTVLKGDRFILRSYSPVRAIGGGVILNALPDKKKRFSDRVLKELELLNSGDLKVQAEQFVRMGRYRGVEGNDLYFMTNSSRKKLDEVIKVLSAQKRIIQYSKERNIFIHADFLEKAVNEITTAIDQYHNANPLKPGLQKEELRSQSSGAGDPRLFNFIVNQLVREGTIVQEKENLRLTGHKVILARDQEKIHRQIEDAYINGGLQPPYFKDLKAKIPDSSVDEILQVLVKDGILVKVKEDLFFSRKAIDDLKEKLVEFLKENKEIDTPQFKEMTGASRKYTIPLIEYFDQSQVTVRVGDNRVLRKQ